MGRCQLWVVIGVVLLHQVRDTVELWRLPNMRKISLRFLASYLLHMEIQV
jgi:carbon starvation protein CstA